MREIAQRVARTWLLQHPGREVPVVRPRVQLTRVPVSEAQFERAMEMVAQAMGGRYVPATSTIKLPKIGIPGDKSFPTELQVLYRRFPCDMVSPGAGSNAGVQRPCVSFDVLPNTPGDPRTSSVYRSFTGEAASAGILFKKFLGWLKILSNAVNRYAQGIEQAASVRVAHRWIRQWVRLL